MKITLLENTEMVVVVSCLHISLQNLHLCLHFYPPVWIPLSYPFVVSSHKQWFALLPPHSLYYPTAVVQLLPPLAAVSQGGTAVCPGPQTHVQGQAGQSRSSARWAVVRCLSPIWKSSGGHGDAVSELDREKAVKNIYKRWTDFFL